jgi:polyhydroxybutyrate depolymerase
MDLRLIRISILLVLLSACTTEHPPSTTSAVTPRLTASLTLQPTAEITPELTASPVVTQNCARGDLFDQLESNGRSRQYLLHVPASYRPEQPAALVLVFHGAGIGAERFVRYSRLSNVADREGFLIVYPQGLGERPAWDPSPGSRDVQFVRDLIDQLEQRCNVDPDRIYASGHSNGGGMVNRLACEMADRIAAIGTVSGAYGAGADCAPARPVPVVAIHGIADQIVPYEGIPDWALGWAKRNGCNPEAVDIPHNVIVREQKWSGCRAGTDVILYTIEDMGHDWTHDIIDMGQTIWDFFEQHPMQKA